jgi:hypothetical protein
MRVKWKGGDKRKSLIGMSGMVALGLEVEETLCVRESRRAGCGVHAPEGMGKPKAFARE